MRVLHINSYDRRGGAETVFQITRKITGSINFSGFADSGHSDKLAELGFRSWEEDNKAAGILNYIFSFHNYTVLKRFLESTPVEIIHLHGFFASLSPSILLAIKRSKRSTNIKVFQTLHDFHLVCPNAGLYNYSRNEICELCIGKKAKLSIFFKNCDRRGWIYSVIKGIRSLIANNIFDHRELIDKFICPSEFLKGRLLADGVDSSKIAVIRNPAVIQKAAVSTPKKEIICYFGRFSREKNLIFLINTFSEWKERTKNGFRLLLIGEGEDEPEMRKTAMAGSFEEEIEIREYMPNEKLNEVLKEVKYLSLTSNCYENAPMTIIEALSLNIIPIAPDLGGMKESIESVVKCGKTYISGSEKSWMETLDFLESHYETELIRLMESQKRIEKDLSTDHYYQEVMKLYKET